MDHAAQDLMEEYPDIVLAFGESDEFRFGPSSPSLFFGPSTQHQDTNAQFPPPKVHVTLQSTAIQDCVNPDVVIHLILRLSLVIILPRYPARLPAEF
jgi:hypothetical protein